MQEASRVTSKQGKYVAQLVEHLLSIREATQTTSWWWLTLVNPEGYALVTGSLEVQLIPGHIVSPRLIWAK